MRVADAHYMTQALNICPAYNVHVPTCPVFEQVSKRRKQKNYGKISRNVVYNLQCRYRFYTHTHTHKKHAVTLYSTDAFRC